MLVNLGFEDPYLYFEEPQPDSVQLLGGNSNGQCTLEGMTWDCMSANRLLEMGAAEQMVSATVFTIYEDGTTRAIWTGLVTTDDLGKAESRSPANAAGGTGSNGHAPDTGSVVLAGTSDSSVTIIGGEAYAFTGPQNPAPGSFEACVGNLRATGFTKEAADLINLISRKEGTSRELLAVTWMNESNFELHPAPNTNGHPEDVMRWDVGPFQINVYWTLKQVAAKEVSFAGLNPYNVFGYNMYVGTAQTTPAAFTGDPLSNG